MSETLIDIPDKLLLEAQEALGTIGERDTVIRSLEEVVCAEARKRVASWVSSLEGSDLDDPEVMSRAWH
jgi:Arc/MetJ family transcription regulator